VNLSTKTNKTKKISENPKIILDLGGRCCKIKVQINYQPVSGLEQLVRMAAGAIVPEGHLPDEKE